MSDLLNDLNIKIIDIDTHVVEPYDLWTSRVSTQKYGNRVPHVRTIDGVDLWFQGDMPLGFCPAAGVAAAGYDQTPPNWAPNLDSVLPHTWRAEDRLKAMDDYGVYAQVMYPNVGGFSGGNYRKLGDMDLALELLKAYNDWQTDYASIAPKRFLPMTVLPFWDIDLMNQEMERCVKKGHKGVAMTFEPESFGEPVLSDKYWDPFWARAEEMGMSINFHVAGGANIDASALEMLNSKDHGRATSFSALSSIMFVGNAKALGIIIFSGICHRFPKLNFVSVESGVSWLPFVLEGMDWMWSEVEVQKEHPEYDLLPSEYFKRQIYGSFWFESGPMLKAAIEQLGTDRVMFETDFPHPTSMSPGPASPGGMSPRDFVNNRLTDMPPDMLRDVLQNNAAKVYHVDLD